MGEAVYSSVQFGEQQMIDMVTENKISERDIEKNVNFFKVK